MKVRTICVITGSRAEYGLLSGLMHEIDRDPALKLEVVCTGSHLSAEHGMTIKQIEEDGFNVAARIDMGLKGDSAAEVTRAMGDELIQFSNYFKTAKVDAVVVLGDRYEILIAAQAAMMAKVPIAHIHGGEVTEGAIDESIRHAITKMAQLHFVSAEDHRRRVIQLGENPLHVYNVGAPGLDAVRTVVPMTRAELEREIGFRFAGRNFLVTFHPETLATKDGPDALFEALDRFADAGVVFTRPNADTGGRAIAEAIDRYASRNPERVKVVASLGQRRYLSLAREVDVVVGNSSSGLIEVPALGRPTVNIGDRQKGRLRSVSVIDCINQADAIEAAIDRALSKKFIQTARSAGSPYGDGHASARIKDVLAAIDLSGLSRKPFFNVSMALPPSSRTLIIAEAGVNHNGDINMAKRLIDAAAEAGADFVKFQSFKADMLVTADAAKAEYQKQLTGGEESQHAMLKRLELSQEAHEELAAYCVRRGVRFLSTPFDEESLEMLVRDFDVPLVKIPSGELTNAPFLLKVAKTGRPIVLSTGMSTLAEVQTALGVLAFGLVGDGEPGLKAFERAYLSIEGRTALREKVTVLHCTTEYPCPMESVNLRAMESMAQAFDLPIGYSDHTTGITVPVAAVARGAVLIEKHFTLDRELPGPDHLASLEPGELKEMVRAIRDVEKAIGKGGKSPAASELANAVVARKSLVAAKEIRKGERFTVENMTTKRPGSGVSPVRYWDYLGRTADRDYAANALIVGEHDSE